jgi:hypothetical protein
MAVSVYKILGQINPAANTETVLYTVPGSNNAIISTVNICNQSGNTVNFSIAVRGGGVTTTAKHYLAFNTAVSSFNSIALTIGMTLSNTDIISANTNSPNVSFMAFGSEIY